MKRWQVNDRPFIKIRYYLSVSPYSRRVIWGPESSQMLRNAQLWLVDEDCSILIDYRFGFVRKPCITIRYTLKLFSDSSYFQGIKVVNMSQLRLKFVCTFWNKKQLRLPKIPNAHSTQMYWSENNNILSGCMWFPSTSTIIYSGQRNHFNWSVHKLQQCDHRAKSSVCCYNLQCIIKNIPKLLQRSITVLL